MNAEKIEREVRFALPTDRYMEFRSIVTERLDEFEQGSCGLETTVMYDNPNPALTFYSKEVDGRLRLRTAVDAKADILTAPKSVGSSLLTWKQRIPGQEMASVRAEREIEVALPAGEMKAVEALLINVLRCPRISSYERRREVLYRDGIEFAVDLFPFGYVIELELKRGDDGSELLAVASEFGLDSQYLSRLSCDDQYRLLCERAGREARTDIVFTDEDMPTIDDYQNSRS